MHVYNAHHVHIATLKEELLTFLPKFSVYHQDEFVGSISREFTFFKPSYQIDYKGWSVQGDFMEWDYEIHHPSGLVARVSKVLLQWTDTYVIDVADPEDALSALMLVLAIDAVNSDRENALDSASDLLDI